MFFTAYSAICCGFAFQLLLDPALALLLPIAPVSTSVLILIKSTPPLALSFHLNPFIPIPPRIALSEEY